jgi:Asp/Glu/hydantoin racemase
MLHIRIITPNADPTPEDRAALAEDLRQLARPELHLSHAWLETGPRRVRTEEDVLDAAPGVVARVLEAEHDDVDAVVIDCTSQPGALEVRRLVRIPVVGAGEASLEAAAATGRSWAVLNPERLHDPIAAAQDHPDVNVLVLGATGHAQTAELLRAAFPDLTIIEPLEAALERALHLTMAI